MPTTNSTQEKREEIRKQKRDAVKKLEELAEDKIKLKRPVFFVPGWTDEDNTCWKTPYLKSYTPIKEWISRMAKNSNLAEYITFTEKQSEKCKSFFDFADILKDKIWSKIGKRRKFDIVGHSMGGLDAVAAILDESEPLLNVNNLISVATPHKGSQFGELNALVNKIIRKDEYHHIVQAINLDPDQPFIKSIDKSEARETILKRVKKLYCFFGTRDTVVWKIGKYNKEDLDPEFYKKKVEIVEFYGASHSGKDGITQDPRDMLAIIHVLLDIELEKPNYNYGYIFKRG